MSTRCINGCGSSCIIAPALAHGAQPPGLRLGAPSASVLSTKPWRPWRGSTQRLAHRSGLASAPSVNPVPLMCRLVHQVCVPTALQRTLPPSVAIAATSRCSSASSSTFHLCFFRVVRDSGGAAVDPGTLDSEFGVGVGLQRQPPSGEPTRLAQRLVVGAVRLTLGSVFSDTGGLVALASATSIESSASSTIIRFL